MKRIKILFFLCLLSAPLISQSFNSIIYSPVLGRDTVIPYAETDFISIRMRGLGYQLHNVVEDTVTNLFRNPVSIYDLNRSLIIANYEQPNVENIRLTEILYPINEIIVLESESNSLNTLSEQSTSTFPFISNPYLSIGYWSPRIFRINAPIGVFLRAQFLDQTNLTNSTDPFRTLSNYNYDVNILDSKRKSNDLWTKLWLGILNSSKLKLGFSYDYLSYSSSSNIFEKQMVERVYSSNIRNDKRINDRDVDYDWRRHKLSFGAKLRFAGWEIESGIAGLIFSNEEDYFSDAFQKSEIYSANRDSLLNFRENDLDEIYNSDKDIKGIEVSLQARRGSYTFFLTGLMSGANLDQNRDDERGIFDISYIDTNRSEFYKERYCFTDDGTLRRLRMGIGKHFQIENFNIYSAIVLGYNRNALNGDFQFNLKEDVRIYNYDTSFVDTSVQSPLDFTSEIIRLEAPIGFEFQSRYFSARLGLSWYFTREKEKLEYQFNRYNSENTSSYFRGEEFFGFGVKYEKAELNVVAYTEVFRFDTWQVGLRYSF